MRERPLATVAAERGLVGGPFGSNLVSKDYTESGVPVIRGTNMLDRYVGGDFAFVSVEKVEHDLARNDAMPGDLIFTQRGTLGQVAMVPEEPYRQYVISQSQMRLRVDESVADRRFVYYACRQPEFMEQIKNNAIATGVPHINLGILNRLMIPDIPLSKQTAIAEVLGALDDKITVNKLAMSIADQLVRAKYISLSGGSASLGAIAVNIREQVDPTMAPARTPYVGLEHVPRRSAWLTEFDYASKATSAKGGFREGDILFGKLRPYFHKVVSAPFDGIASTDILVIRAKRPELAGLVLAAASSDAAIEATTASSEGTRMPRTKWADLAALPVPWPGEEEAVNFSREVKDLVEWTNACMQESRRLAATRDELLPFLLSGRIRVSDVRENMEGVL